MTNKDLENKRLIICERCGIWHKSELEYETHLKVMCNVDVQIIVQGKGDIQEKRTSSKTVEKNAVPVSQLPINKPSNNEHINPNGNLPVMLFVFNSKLYHICHDIIYMYKFSSRV